MAGRNHIPAHALNHLREPPPLALARAPHPTALIEDPRLLLHHRPPPPSAVPHPHHHSALVEERLAAQHRDIQSLLLDNQRLAATHVALKQELSAAQQEIRHLSATAGTVKAERDAQVREVYERSLKMEAEARLIDGLGSELAQVRADVQKLIADRKELTVKLKDVEEDLVRAQSEAQQVPVIKSEIETMHKEIQRGRAAIEFEKKTHASNLEQGQAMERNLISMAREIEKLRAELANSEKRARASAAAAVVATPGPGYAAGYGNPEAGYGGNLYSDPYAVFQAHGGADVGPQYGHGAVPHSSYDVQQPHIHR
ncbi:hypothetical protein LguiB_000663 [Lonicera macranthoides]